MVALEVYEATVLVLLLDYLTSKGPTRNHAIGCFCLKRS